MNSDVTGIPVSVDDSAYTAMLVHAWKEPFARAGYTGIERDLRRIPMTRSDVRFGAVAFWREDCEAPDGVIVMDVKFYDSNGMSGHGTGAVVVGKSVDRFVTAREHTRFFETDNLLEDIANIVGSRPSTVDLNGVVYTGCAMFDVFGFRNYLAEDNG